MAKKGLSVYTEPWVGDLSADIERLIGVDPTTETAVRIRAAFADLRAAVAHVPELLAAKGYRLGAGPRIINADGLTGLIGRGCSRNLKSIPLREMFSPSLVFQRASPLSEECPLSEAYWALDLEVRNISGGFEALSTLYGLIEETTVHWVPPGEYMIVADSRGCPLIALDQPTVTITPFE